jgi:RimJ/RimL family protein N-acetyltransferase
MILRVAPPDHWCWIAERAKLTIGPGFGAMEAIEDLRGAEGPVRILGMVGFDGWTPNSVSLHVALDSPIALRKLVRQCFGMAFDQFKREVVTGIVLSSNERALKLDRHLGYREVFRGRDWYAPGIDMVALEMRREDCRFLDRNTAAPHTWNASAPPRHELETCANG